MVYEKAVYPHGCSWSLFTKELLKLIFENLAKVTAEINVTPNMTIAEVVL